MKCRKLRIAWSVAWGVVAVLLVVLWVRSYWWCDIRTAFGHNAVTLLGSFYFDAPVQFEVKIPSGGTLVGTVFTSSSPVHIPADNSYLSVYAFSAPLAVFPIAIIAIATLPWLRFRFSLRTLLIVTTIVAVILGLIVWAVK